MCWLASTIRAVSSDRRVYLVATIRVDKAVNVNAVTSMVGRMSYGMNILIAPIANDRHHQARCRKVKCRPGGR
jgi:hypothetical protein